MALFLLILLIAIIIVFDKRYHKTYYTPSIILSVPFLIICILYDLNSDNLGFKPLDYDVLYIWFFGLIIFWVAGTVTNVLIPIKVVKTSLSEKKNDIKNYSRKLVNFSFLIAIILTYFLITSYNLYITQGGEVVEKFLGVGIQAHLVIVFKLLSIISFLALFGDGNRLFKFKNVYVVFVAIGLSIMYATKSGVLILLMSYFLSWIFFFNKTIRITHILLALGLGFGIFFASYSLVFGYLAPIDFIWNHMLLYYVSGTASMNAYFSAQNPVGIEPDMLFRTLNNIFYTLTGNSGEIKTVISNEWTDIGNGTVINVKTFFGTIYLYGGLTIGIISVMIFSIISNIIFKLSKRKNSFIFLVLSCYVLALLCFGWFDFYMNSVAFYESIFFAVIFNFLLIRKAKYE